MSEGGKASLASLRAELEDLHTLQAQKKEELKALNLLIATKGNRISKLRAALGVDRTFAQHFIDATKSILDPEEFEAIEEEARRLRGEYEAREETKP